MNFHHFFKRAEEVHALSAATARGLVRRTAGSGGGDGGRLVNSFSPHGKIYKNQKKTATLLDPWEIL